MEQKLWNPIPKNDETMETIFGKYGTPVKKNDLMW